MPAAHSTYNLVFNEVTYHLIRQLQKEDLECVRRCEQLENGTINGFGVDRRRGLFLHGAPRLYIPANLPCVRLTAMSQMHKRKFRELGHYDEETTLLRLKCVAFWPTIDSDVHEFFLSCTLCRVTEGTSDNPTEGTSDNPIIIR